MNIEIREITEQVEAGELEPIKAFLELTEIKCQVEEALKKINSKTILTNNN